MPDHDKDHDSQPPAIGRRALLAAGAVAALPLALAAGSGPEGEGRKKRRRRKRRRTPTLVPSVSPTASPTATGTASPTATATATPSPTATPIPGGKRTLSPADVAFAGAFRLPASAAGGQDAAWGRSLALRRVGGEVRMLSATVPEAIYEVRVPALGMAAPFPLAEETRAWPDVFQGRRLLDGDPGRYNILYGLHWDEEASRLWWSYGDWYNTVSPSDPCLGWSTLRDDGTAEAHGPWRFADRSVKMAMGGVLAVPRAFADAHLGGRRLAAGMGGYFSIVAVGPASMGPALTAFDPAALGAEGGFAANLPLVGYPFNATPGAGPDRCHRDPDYREEYEDGDWNPAGGTGFWQWNDLLWQGGAWVDTPAVEGVLFALPQGNGRLWYGDSNLHCERGSMRWHVYDPADLAAVARGEREQWGIQPARSWRPDYPGIPAELPGWDGEAPNMISGVVFDPVDARLYVAVRFAWTGEYDAGTTVYAFDVARA